MGDASIHEERTDATPRSIADPCACSVRIGYRNAAGSGEGRVGDGPAGGVEATTTITSAGPTPRVIVLTTYGTDAGILAALEAGAVGYLLKDAPRRARPGHPPRLTPLPQRSPGDGPTDG